MVGEPTKTDSPSIVAAAVALALTVRRQKGTTHLTDIVGKCHSDYDGSNTWTRVQ